MSSGEALLERAGAWERIQRLVDNAATGRGGLLLVEGDPGQGKTALLRHLAGSASDRLLVRTAQGSELEQSLAWGVARQLLATGDTSFGASDAPAEDPVAMCFGLTEKCAELAESSLC